MRFILTLLALLLLPHTVFALDLIHPAPGEANVEVDSYFQWGKIPGTVKYVLDVDKFTQSEDNIPPSKCSGSVCTFSFLDLTSGVIQYLSSYTWSITAVNAAGNPIDSSGISTFTTEQAPPGPPPGTPPPGTPPPGDGDGETPIDPSKLNPISAQNITELFNKIFSFLFGLAIFIVPVIVIYAAFLMLMGGGDPVKLQKGRMILFWTAVAFIIILLSRGLPVVFKNLL
jgi:hypothetical protein